MTNIIRFTGREVLIFILALGLVAGFGGFAALLASNAAHAAGEPKRVIVTFNHAVNEDARAALLNFGGRVLKELPLVNGAAVLLPNEAAVNNVGALAGVRSVEPDVQVFALYHRPGHDKGAPGGGGDDGSTQPAQTLEWGADRIDVELVWGESAGAGINVAIVDTGIDLDHRDLNVVRAVDCTRGPNCDKGGSGDDDNGHGTHVAGIVAALNNTIGVVGVAPKASLFAVKVLNSQGSGFLSDVIEGIGWAVDNGADVVNMSLGTGSDIRAFHDAVDAAYVAGVVLVAAAGNSGDGDGSTNEVVYPAKYSSVIAVAATASDDSTPTWSSEGKEVELAAPGVSIRSTWNDGLYKTISGTSMAAPHAAGTVALVLATAVQALYDADLDGVWDPAEVRAALQAAADDLGTAGHDNFYGYGLLDAEESVTGTQTNP